MTKPVKAEELETHTFGGLHGRTALVTGASAGLGAHFAMTLARAGAKVTLLPAGKKH